MTFTVVVLARTNEDDTPAEPRRPKWRRVLSAVCLLAGCLMLLGGLSGKWSGDPSATAPLARARLASVASASGPSANTPRAVTRDIEDVEVGDRTAGRNPLREQVESDSPEPDPATWRKLVLWMEKDSGGVLRATLLRPVEWIKQAGVTAGGTFFLNLPEMGAVGEARVEAVEPCPAIRPGPGNVVTGTFHHEAAPGQKILQVEFSDGAVIQGVTDNHPFWSVDRQDFVPAGELAEGDFVRAGGGLATVASITSRLALPGEKLYNLEVQGEHVYQVTTAGILVHNNCPVPGTGRKAGQAYKARVRPGRPGRPKIVSKKPVKHTDIRKIAARQGRFGGVKGSKSQATSMGGPVDTGHRGGLPHGHAPGRNPHGHLWFDNLPNN